ncbi:radical SAM protein [Anaerosporobacter sp.]
MDIQWINRHRIDIDGVGITSLVSLPGCPLSCSYCINKEILKREDLIKTISEEDLIDILSIDHSYFLYTNGGITFGGGEPLLQWKHLLRFASLCPSEWNLTIETSLNVPTKYLEPLLQKNFSFIIDIKSLDTRIYREYTGRDNHQVLSNLKLIRRRIPSHKYAIKVPIIPGYTDNKSQQDSIYKLREFGINQETIIPFTYITP